MTFRSRSQRDKNHGTIAAALRAIGATVVDTHTLGGFVDMVVGYRGQTYLIEVKNAETEKKVKKSATLMRQKEFRDSWRGHPVAVVRTKEEAVKAVGGMA